MRDILRAWRDENMKKPVNISLDDALQELGLDPSQLNP